MAKILIVEDSADFRALVSRVLQNDGYELVLAGSIGEALMSLEAHRFALIVLDMTLPDGDGAQMCRELRSAPGPAPKILLMTGRLEFAEANGYGQVGADDGIAKPFRPQDLRQKVQALLDAPTLKRMK